MRRRLGTAASSQDCEDVAGDILLDLLARVDSVRRGESEPIDNPAAYTAIASHHGCDKYLRRRFPQRHRLGTRVRYLLENSSLYSLWQDAEGSVCGLRNQRSKAARTDLGPGWVSAVVVPDKPDELKAVSAVFAYARAPLRLPDLIEAVAALLNIRDRVVSTSDIDVAGPEVDIDGRLDQRQTLSRLWREIALLPQPQRAALLLNLRDEDGGCALTSLPATGVASLRQIAAVLEVPAEKLAELWIQLPLSDLAIAEMLGVSRQQVINLRKSARERLGRRMAGNFALDSNIGPKPASMKVEGQN